MRRRKPLGSADSNLLIDTTGILAYSRILSLTAIMIINYWLQDIGKTLPIMHPYLQSYNYYHLLKIFMCFVINKYNFIHVTVFLVLCIYTIF